MNSLLDSAQRRRQGLNPLTTSLQPQQFQAPISAVGLSSPFGYQASPSAYTPVSAVRQYNPQQWGPGGGPESRYSPAGGQEVEAPAPPPYSPPRSQRPATLSPQEPSSSTSPMNRTGHRPSPEIASAAFPPPPGNHSRALSRDRTQPLFGLGNVFRKNTTPDTPESFRASQDSARDYGPAVRRPLQISIEPMRTEEPEPRPPASRRAASAGAIGTPTSSRSRGSSTTRWEPGMPLPPPPPGPPPQASSRSQSMTRAPDPIISPPTRRPQTISSLGPVPPTPAGWVDEDAIPNPRMGPRGKSPHPGLQIDTSSVTTNVAPDSNSGSSSSGLYRARAVRGEPKSIRERRSESRTGRNTSDPEPSNNPWAEAITPSDIVVPMTVLGRRPTITKSTPRSGRSFHGIETPNSSKTVGQNTPTLNLPQSESRGSTPRPPNSSNRLEAPTPPFSPNQYTPSNQYAPNHTTSNHNTPSMIPPKSLPTPPPQPQSQPRRRTNSSPRPVSHILHTPLKDKGMPAPLSPIRAPSRQSTTASSPSLESFAQAAAHRHEIFTQKEAHAENDEERVRIFADFIVSESRIRREKYASAIDAMGSEILELTRDLFRPYSRSHRNSSGSFSGDRPTAMKEQRPSRTSLPALQTASHSDSTPSSASSMASPAQNGRPESTWWNGYMPSLSPIASISASGVPDESSSRGRPSSRWWEVGQSGSGGSPTILERSKRESKYMGMPRELRESLQWETNVQSSSSACASSIAAGPSTQTSYGPNEYPPEKVGWHEETQNPLSPPMGKTPTTSLSYSPAPPTPNPRHLDVSRLVTLPPPYPRHHPAVNNNHPDLTAIRTSVRALSDFTEVEATKQRFVVTEKQMLEAETAAASKRRQSLRTNIQREIEAGSMSYADAAKAEADFTHSEADATKQSSKASFELFQTSVVAPLNDLLMERVHRSSTLFSQLRSQLFVDAQATDPNATQEEGDEQPELLEKLTLLKWIFEAREQLHREIYDILSDRNDRYRDMVIIPYRLSGNMDKVANAERFFADDAAKRQLEYDNDVLARTTEFMDIVETNVVQGVEVQLSAFWDIAPSLRSLAEKIPRVITDEFRVQIPGDEYDENPGYYEHPLQYLYSLLEHGQKSTYQFIESQINLLCLLHEVKSAVTAASCRARETERIKNGEEKDIVAAEARSKKESEDLKLTDDLKEKVRCVEELWESALGGEIEGVKGRVKEFLVREGGWEGMEEGA